MIINDIVFGFARTLDALQGPKPPRVGVEAGAAVSEFELSGFGQENPTRLFREKGMDIADEMLADDAVGGFVELKNSVILSRDWEIEPASKDPAHVEQAEYIEKALDLLPGSLKEKLDDTLTGTVYGYSIQNTPIGIIERGDFKGRVYFSDLKGKEPHAWRFKMDRYRNIEALIQTDPDTYRPVEHDLNQFVVYCHRRRWGDPFGQSDLVRCYREWNMKKYFLRYWAMHLERFGSGHYDVAYEPGAENKPDHQAIKDFVENMMVKAALLHSDKYKVTLHEAGGEGFDAYEAAMTFMNAAIARGLLVPELVMSTSKSGGGAYALGQEHADTFFMTGHKQSSAIEEQVMFDQYIRRSIDMNWPNVDDYPRFRFKSLTKAQELELLTKFIAAADKGIVGTVDADDHNRARQILGWPIRVVDPNAVPLPEEAPEEPTEPSLPTEPDEDEDEEIEETLDARFHKIADEQTRRIAAYVAANAPLKPIAISRMSLPCRAQMIDALESFGLKTDVARSYGDEWADTALAQVREVLHRASRTWSDGEWSGRLNVALRKTLSARTLFADPFLRSKLTEATMLEILNKNRVAAMALVALLETRPRTILAGGPRTGKSTVAVRAGERFRRTVMHADSLVGADMDWSEMSSEVSTWFDKPGDWIIEGVAIPRAIRKWIAANPDKKLDAAVVWMNNPVQKQTPKQRSMSKACATVWREVAPKLAALGVEIIDATNADHTED